MTAKLVAQAAFSVHWHQNKPPGRSTCRVVHSRCMWFTCAVQCKDEQREGTCTWSEPRVMQTCPAAYVDAHAPRRPPRLQIVRPCACYAHGSIHRAKNEFLQTAGARATSPFYWASFVLMGDPGHISDRSMNKIWYLLIGLSLLTGLVLVLRKRKASKPSWTSFYSRFRY